MLLLLLESSDCWSWVLMLVKWRSSKNLTSLMVSLAGLEHNNKSIVDGTRGLFHKLVYATRQTICTLHPTFEKLFNGEEVWCRVQKIGVGRKTVYEMDPWCKCKQTRLLLREAQIWIPPRLSLLSLIHSFLHVIEPLPPQTVEFFHHKILKYLKNLMNDFNCLVFALKFLQYNFAVLIWCMFRPVNGFVIVLLWLYK